VPEQVSGTELLPAAVDLDPAAAAGDDLDALFAAPEGNGGRMQAGALMIVRDGEELDAQGTALRAGFTGIRCFDNKS